MALTYFELNMIFTQKFWLYQIVELEILRKKNEIILSNFANQITYLLFLTIFALLVLCNNLFSQSQYVIVFNVYQ